MAGLPDPTDDDPSKPWGVREPLLSIIVGAAVKEKEWQLALDVNSEIRESKRRRGAPDLERASTAFNDHGPLLELGRITEARELLIGCRQVFEDSGDIHLLAGALSALATVEHKLDHFDRALDLEREVLRYVYVTMRSNDIAIGHINFALYLERVGAEPQQIGAHRLAAAIIFYQTGHDGSLSSTLIPIGQLMGQEASAVPASFTEMCRIAEQVPGVHLANLVSQLPRRATDPQMALEQVLNLAAQADREAQLSAQWDPLLSALHISLTHPDPDTRRAARRVFDLNLPVLAPYQQELTAVLRRIHAGEREADLLLPGLQQADRAIAQRALAYLAGDPNLAIDPEAWQELRTDTDETDEESLEAFIAPIVKAARGDIEMRRAMNPIVDYLSEDPAKAAFADALREIINGGDPPVSAHGLDPGYAEMLETIRHNVANPDL